MKRFKNGYTVVSEEVNMMRLGIPPLLAMFVVLAVSAVVLIWPAARLCRRGIFAVAWDIDHGAARQPASVVVRRSSGMAEFTGISARHAVTISCFGSCRLRRDVWAEWAAQRA